MILNALSVCIFIFACIVASSDAQGALAFLFYLPIAAVLFLVSAMRAKNKKGRWVSISGLIFIILFVVFAFIPGLAKIPATVIGVVSSGFELVTGKTPYAWNRAHSK